MNIDPSSLGIYSQYASAGSQGLGNVVSDALGSVGASGANGVPSSTTGASFSFKLPQHVDPSTITANPETSQTALSDLNEPTSWGQMVQRMALDVNQAQTTAGEKVRDVLAGGTTSVNEAMIAVQESSVRFQMLAEVRNKMLEAYQEVMRMQV